MTDLTTQLRDRCATAFEAIGLEARWAEVRRSDRPELADFQCNGAMGAARSAGRKPREKKKKRKRKTASVENKKEKERKVQITREQKSMKYKREGRGKEKKKKKKKKKN